MTTPMWCLLVIAFMPYVLALLGIYYRIEQFGDWDNANPRAQYARLEGAGWRVWAAQQNAWEALGLFTATVAVAHLGPGPMLKSPPWQLLCFLLHACCIRCCMLPTWRPCAPSRWGSAYSAAFICSYLRQTRNRDKREQCPGISR